MPEAVLTYIETSNLYEVLEVQKSSLKYKKVIEIFLMMMIFLIGLSRIYLGVHYFSDVIGGFLLSLSYLLFIYYNTSLYT